MWIVDRALPVRRRLPKYVVRATVPGCLAVSFTVDKMDRKEPGTERDNYWARSKEAMDEIGFPIAIRSGITFVSTGNSIYDSKLIPFPVGFCLERPCD
jgi:hypothetical protein